MAKRSTRSTKPKHADPVATATEYVKRKADQPGFSVRVIPVKGMFKLQVGFNYIMAWHRSMWLFVCCNPLVISASDIGWAVNTGPVDPLVFLSLSVNDLCPFITISSHFCINILKWQTSSIRMFCPKRLHCFPVDVLAMWCL